MTSANSFTQYALNDFAVRQAAIALNKSIEDVYAYGNSSMNFMNVFDPTVVSDGFAGFMQRRYPVCLIVLFLSSSTQQCARRTERSHSALQTPALRLTLFPIHVLVVQTMRLDFTNVRIIMFYVRVT